MAKRISITAYPWATAVGMLTIPDNISDDEIRDYILNKWDEIEFDLVDLDYENSDFEYEEW